MNNKLLLSILIFAVLAILGAGVYWYLYLKPNSTDTISLTDDDALIFDTSNIDTTSNQNNYAGGITPDRSVLPKLRLISNEVVAGATAFTTETGEVRIRFNERTLGDIFETTNTSDVVTRIVRGGNDAVKGIFDTHWVHNGNGFVFRYVDEATQHIRTFYGELVENSLLPEDDTPLEVTSVYTLDTRPILSSYKEIAVSPNNTQIFYITTSEDEAAGRVVDEKNPAPRRVFLSPLTEWQTSWPKQDTLLITNKPANSIEGYVYTINPESSQLTRVLGPIEGLTAVMSPDGNYILYSKGSGATLTAHLYSKETNISNILPITTLPEKCVWALDSTKLYCGIDDSITPAAYPDSWYQGRVSFSDKLWEINIETLEKELLIDPEEFARVEIDLIKPFLGPNGNYLYFINKKDSSLWSFELQEELPIIIEDMDDVEVEEEN